MDSARGFVRLWLGLTLSVLTYAWLDLRMNPRLERETQFSMRPNLDQAWDLLHWGGRLLNHGALYMLIGNAIMLSGMAALVLRGAARWLVLRRRPGIERRVSIVPGPAPTSVRPPNA